MYHVRDSTSFWNNAGGMNSILAKDVSTLGVLMKFRNSVVEYPTQKSHTCLGLDLVTVKAIAYYLHCLH